jgi:alkaline phosphatase D
MKRREFLQRTGWFVVGASLVGIPGCSDDKTTTPPTDGGPEPEQKGTYSFPQGVASGDPRADSVVLWTRVVRNADNTTDVNVRVQVAFDDAYSATSLVADRIVTATAGSDHAIRVLITNLAAGKAYRYRFIAGSDEIAGRTQTAPSAKADVQVNLAWVSCQDYGAGHYSAYRQMIVDDDARPDADKIFAVVHLGDMIYETRADGFQTALDDNFQPIMLTNPGGAARTIDAFPSGGGTRASVNFAATVDDYRHLYKTFLSDPDIQAARARWPWVTIWDDHEFTDDCWQSQANYTSDKTLDETDQTRRLAASQAWFEYTPAHLTGAEGVGGVDNEAHDFKAPAKAVVDAAFTAPDDDNFVDEPNNAAAIGAITIYRSLRFGKHVELVMTDERSYRSDHALPEEITSNPAFLAPRNALPLALVGLFDQGKTANGGNPPPSVDLGNGLVIPNLRAGSPPGTMLGAAQKAWWKATMMGSDATWKLWGNEVTMMRLRIQAAPPALASDLALSADSWDGYPTERAELMGFLKDNAIKNVVVLSGDIHASFAGLVMDNFDAPNPTPVACELVGPGISSNSLFSFFEFATRAAPAALRGIITVDATTAGGAKFTENFNLLLRGGTKSAGAFAQTLDLGVAKSDGVFDPNANGHLKYADTNTQGYGYVKVTKDNVQATIVTINRPIVTPSGTTGPGVKRTASFTISKDDPASMTAATFTGTKPFPET